MMKLSNGLALVTAAVCITSASTTAFAGGIGGDVLEIVCGGCGLGRAADKWNAENGNPVDHAAAAVANEIIPGSGVVLEGAWAYQRLRGDRAYMPGAGGMRAARPTGDFGNSYAPPPPVYQPFTPAFQPVAAYAPPLAAPVFVPVPPPTFAPPVFIPPIPRFGQPVRPAFGQPFILPGRGARQMYR